MNRTAILIGMLAMSGVGCDEPMNNIIVHDMAVKTGQDANMGTPIGAQCSLTSDCKTGTNPSCVKKRNTKTGMCTAECVNDADCGTGNVCLFAPTDSSGDPGACAKACQAETDCTEGLGCWITLGIADSGACWPTDGISQGGKALTIDCDPTVAGCTFTGSVLPGGCSRQLLGAGMAGHCQQGCEIGVGTCPATSGGSPQSCYFLDETLDSTGMATGDAMKQAVCVFVLPEIADGVVCTDPMDMNMYYDICQIGSQCDIFMTTTNATPDTKCHKLCYLGNFTPPDAGALFTDGGIATACTGGTVCTDVYNVGASPTAPAMPIGLCK